MKRPVNIIGIAADFHDSAACLLQDGRLIAAAQEERFSRVKHDSAMPSAAYRYCLEEAGLDVMDIDCIAYYEDPGKKLGRQLWMGLPHIPQVNAKSLRRLDGSRAERQIREILGYEGPIEFVDHHLSHAASSFYFSGFKEAAILTVDGVGEWATTAFGRGCGDSIELFEQLEFPHSIGLLYSTLTAYLGFGVNDGEYKVMGLAPYGKPEYAPQLRKLIAVSEGGQFQLNLEYFDFIRGERMFSNKFIELLGREPRQPESELSQFWKDLARSLQLVLEELLLEKTRYIHARTGADFLCMAGGVALNCVANATLKREGPFKDIFVQPAANDSGGAIGAASIAHCKLRQKRKAKKLPQKRMTTLLLGPRYSNDEIRELLSAGQAEFEDHTLDEVGLINAVSDLLANGNVVGWFHGRMEFGPRALGARSILADPRIAEMRVKINAKVKKRESFRPFAPSVLVEECRTHFDLNWESPFMLETCQVVSSLPLEAITHVDNSARVQTVSRETNPRYYDLIKAFGKKTGCPLLLNTSFNLRGQPIVNTPVDAILCFIASDLDYLVLENFVLKRDRLGDFWLDLLAKNTSPIAEGVSNAVYSFL